jgi:hypothetical protein
VRLVGEPRARRWTRAVLVYFIVLALLSVVGLLMLLAAIASETGLIDLYAVPRSAAVPFVIVFVSLCVLGWIVNFVTNSLFVLSRRRRRRRFPSTQALVVGTEPAGMPVGSRWVDVEFALTDGTLHRTRPNWPSVVDVGVGCEVLVTYDPAQPDDVDFVSNQPHKDVYHAVYGCLFGIACVLLVLAGTAVWVFLLDG